MQIIKYTFNIIFVIFLFLCVEPLSKAQDTLQIKSDTVPLRKHSPAKAAFLSAALPGLGQIYNGKGISYRLPILYAGIAVETYFIFTLNKQYYSYHNVYVNYTNYIKNLNGASPNTKQLDNILADVGFKSTSYNIPGNLKDANDFYRHWRDFNVIMMAGVYLLNIVDATVQAYFFEYDISDDLSLRVRPTIMNTLTNKGVVGLKLTFNLH